MFATPVSDHPRMGVRRKHFKSMAYCKAESPVV
jgi:hypothetical protein